MQHQTTLAKRQHPLAPLLIVVVVIACLAPFLNKAFHMDDPLFVWTAKQIQQHPLDFYGFNVNWYGAEAPMAAVTKNPPLASYYLVLAGAMFGWSELALHLAMLLPAIAVALGTFILARELGANPWFSALATVLTPVFLVSSSNVMCDTLMLAFWMWAVFFWMRGLRTASHSLLLAAALLIALAALTKYFGVALIPLLFAFALAHHHRVASRLRLGSWIGYFLLPIAVLALYQWITPRLYGRGLLSDAVSYANDSRMLLGGRSWPNLVTGLGFLGGCIISVLFCTPFLWGKRMLLLIAGAATCLVASLLLLKTIGQFALHTPEGFRWGVLLQLAPFVAGGVCLLLLAVTDLYRHRDPQSLLLFLWVLGTFIFATFLNWTINARSLLPLAPAAAILLALRLEDRRCLFSIRNWRLVASLALSAALSLAVTWSDCEFANHARLAARAISSRYGGSGMPPVAFMGHWGFQYYMQEYGGKPIELANTRIALGHIAVMPSIGSNMYDLFDLGDAVTAIEKIVASGPRWITTLNTGMGAQSVGAGFYSDVLGPLPFVAGPVPPEFFMVYKATGVAEYHYVSPANYERASQLCRQANTLLAEGRVREAIWRYTEAVTVNPGLAEAHFQLAMLLPHTPDAQRAITELRYVLNLQPDLVEALNNLAWILATHPDPQVRNGPEAIRLSSRAVELTRTNNPGALDTLAAAYAETGDFSRATDTLLQALALAKPVANDQITGELKAHLELYRARRPLSPRP